MKQLKPAFTAVIGLSALSLCACGNDVSSASSSSLPSSASSSGEAPVSSISTFDGTHYYDSVADRAAFDKTNERNIEENFTNGAMSDSNWNALSGVWQNDMPSYPHNGVQSRNLFYVKNGEKTLLGLKGRGIYSSDSDTRVENGFRYPEGACIVSKNNLGPGRFEIEMAAMPREGGVSAMWTYCTTTGSEASSQNEIDIELGGNTSETYMREWCTTWTTHSTKATVNVDCSRLCYLNDGVIHKYTFDWYTDYQNTGKRRVDWFLDGVLIATVTGDEVPETEMPLWIGLWLPNWSSSAAFDTDYLLVNSIKYTAFDERQYFNECRAKAGYTQVAPSSANIQTLAYEDVKNINKLSNGDFETLDLCKQDSTYFGWRVDTASKGKMALSSDKTSGVSSLALTAGTGSGTHGEYVMQNISNAFGGYRYHYAIDAKKAVADADAQIEFHFSTPKGVSLKQIETIRLDSLDWKTYAGDITMPESAGNLRMDLVVNDGSALFDNASVRFLGTK